MFILWLFEVIDYDSFKFIEYVSFLLNQNVFFILLNIRIFYQRKCISGHIYIGKLFEKIFVLFSQTLIRKNIVRNLLHKKVEQIFLIRKVFIGILWSILTGHIISLHFFQISSFIDIFIGIFWPWSKHNFNVFN